MTADTLIGPFRLVRSLGKGSTGEVFFAERIEAFPQRVAIKLLADVGDGAGAIGANHEADVLVALDHPYIVKLIDRGALPDGRRFIVMEYIDGEPIDAYCDHHALTNADRVRLLIKVMEALSHSHRHLIIHSDLKPPNIMVTSGGAPKLLDFGIAQRYGGEGPTGYTPLFASPEQKAATRLTAASDVYSLGVIADGLLGKGRGRDLDAIVQAATRLEPDERYASIDAFKADLQCFLDGRDVSSRPSGLLTASLRWVGRHQAITAAVVVIAMTISLAAAGVVQGATRAAEQRALARAQLHDLVTLTGALEGELYDSVGHLPQSGPARDVLLRGAGDTLATLAARDTDDSLLSRELARQYSRLATLQWDDALETSDPAAARRAAVLDIDQGLRLLDSIKLGDPEYVEAQRDIDSMRSSPIALSR
jgi:serine/threonine-protein kinase